MTEQEITLSERLEILKLSHERRKLAKLQLDDVAEETAELEEEGVEIEEL